MKIRGKEIQLFLTVGASLEIAELCPEKDLYKMDELFGEKKVTELVTVVADILAILANGGEKNRALNDENYAPCTYRSEDFLAMGFRELINSQKDIMDAVLAGSETSIKAEEEEEETSKNVIPSKG